MVEQYFDAKDQLKMVFECSFQNFALLVEDVSDAMGNSRYRLQNEHDRRTRLIRCDVSIVK